VIVEVALVIVAPNQTNPLSTKILSLSTDSVELPTARVSDSDNLDNLANKLLEEFTGIIVDKWRTTIFRLVAIVEGRDKNTDCKLISIAYGCLLNEAIEINKNVYWITFDKLISSTADTHHNQIVQNVCSRL
jgi:hypothetical protein